MKFKRGESDLFLTGAGEMLQTRSLTPCGGSVISLGVAPVVVLAPSARFLFASSLSVCCLCHLSVAVWVSATVQKHRDQLDLQTNFKSISAN